MALHLPNFPEFEIKPNETVATRFDKWVKRLDLLFKAMDVKDVDRQQAMLLHYAGEEVNDIFETLTLPQPSGDPPGPDILARSVAALKNHFEPQKCLDHHVYNFRKECQSSDENVAGFHTRLQLLAKRCEFANADLEIKRQIIQGCRSSRLRRKALEESLTLDRLLKVARSMETAEEHSAEIEGQSTNALQINRSTRSQGYQYQKRRVEGKVPCGLCGGASYPHKGKCPAEGRACFKCGTQNHFARVCRTRKPEHTKESKSKPQVHALNESDNEENPEEDTDGVHVHDQCCGRVSEKQPATFQDLCGGYKG